MLTFDEEKHEYKVDGKPIISVTQVMNRIATKKTDNEDEFWKPVSGGVFVRNETAAEFGKALHKIAQLFALGKNCKYDTAMQPWVNGLEKFLSAFSSIKVIETEWMLYSSCYGYCGTMDLYGEFRNRPLVLDWKSSVGIDSKWDLQTAAYEQLAKEHCKDRRKFTRWAVQIIEDDYRVIERTYHPEDFNMFLSLLNVWKCFH